MIASRSRVGALLLAGSVLAPVAVTAQEPETDGVPSAATVRLSAHVTPTGSSSGSEGREALLTTVPAKCAPATADRPIEATRAEGRTTPDGPGRLVGLRLVCVGDGMPRSRDAGRVGTAPLELGSPADPGLPRAAVLTLRMEAF